MLSIWPLACTSYLLSCAVVVVVVGLFLDIFWLFWVLEGVVFDDFDWDLILGSNTKQFLRV